MRLTVIENKQNVALETRHLHIELQQPRFKCLPCISIAAIIDREPRNWSVKKAAWAFRFANNSELSLVTTVHIARQKNKQSFFRQFSAMIFLIFNCECLVWQKLEKPRELTHVVDVTS